MIQRLALLALSVTFGLIACAKHEDGRIHDLRQAAERGDADAEAHLGLEYRMGRSVPRDDAQAKKWFRKAAEHGSMWAFLARDNQIADPLKLIVEESDRLEQAPDASRGRRCSGSGNGAFKNDRMMRFANSGSSENQKH